MAEFMGNTRKKIWKAIDSFANSTAGSVGQGQPQPKKPLPPKKEQSVLWYAEWNEDYMSSILNNSLAQKGLQTIADKYYSKQVEAIVSQASLLSKESFPTLYNIYRHCIDTLKTTSAPNVYITNKLRGINALSVEANKKQIILLGRRTPMLLSSDELAFILGHELGHHQQGNLAAHTVNGLMNSLAKASEVLGPMLKDAIEIPLKRWCRQSEFNADRAGFLCCQSMDVIISLFEKVYETPRRTSYHNITELYADHPFIQTRIDRIQKFAHSLLV